MGADSGNRTWVVILWVLVPLASAPLQLAGQSEWRTDFSRAVVPLEEIVSGGPPKDGIPALDDPSFVSVAAADRWLEGPEPVLVVANGGVVRIYPYQILIWHEIVNDVLGDLPLTVTYCPLCNTGLVFRRRLGERVLDFGTTGRLRHSDLVMYDRQTETWWQQATGEGIVGELAGERLVPDPAQTVSWETAEQAHPGARVLSRDTGHDRSEGPIASFFSGELDGRLPPMERVAAVTLDGRSVAYPFSVLSRRRVVNDEVAERPVVAWWTPGTASALDSRRIAEGRDVGASGVFLRQLGDRTLTFEPEGDHSFRDRQTGSRWSPLGRAVEGPLAGQALEPIPHGDYLWFAWAAFRPETEIRGR